MHRLLLFLFLLLCLPVSVYAEKSYQPGLQTLTFCEPAKGILLDVSIWYPTRRAPTSLTFGSWTFNASRRAQPASPGPFPLILLSHDSGGNRFSHNPLAIALAKQGFIVAAPTHRQDNIDRMPQLFTPDQLATRARELSDTLSLLLEHAVLSKMIDAKRIGVAGIGTGGAAALLLGGARLDGSGWKQYCAQAGSHDPYCTPWVAPRMKAIASAIKETSFHLPPLKAVAAAAPSFGMLFSPQSLKGLRLPVLLLRADLDAINRSPYHADHIRDSLPTQPEFGVLKRCDNASLIGACTPAAENLLPDLCLPSPKADRNSAQQQMAEKIGSFMKRHLGFAND